MPTSIEAVKLCSPLICRSLVASKSIADSWRNLNKKNRKQRCIRDSLCALVIACATVAHADPSAPSSLAAIPSSSAQINLSWAGATNAAGYYVLRDGLTIAAVSNVSYKDQNVQGLGQYSYNVVAYDTSGGTSAPSQTVTVSMPPAGYTLTFDDEFAGSALDLSKWHPNWQWGTLNDTYPNDEALTQNVSISNGSAHFAVTKGRTPSGRAYGAAVVTTAGTFSQQYGYWEARVKMPANAQGIWPAFWLVAADGTWPPEIDIMEWLGNAPNIDDMTVHYNANNQSAENIFAGPDFSADYHVLGLLWTARELSWYVDRVKQFTTTAGIPNKPLIIILNNSTGGWNNNAVNSTTVFPSRFDVDYVRVYAGSQGGVTTGSDTTPPSPPTNLAAATQSNQVALTWSASTDNVGVKGYRVFRNGSLLASVATNSYQDKQVSGSTRYVYAVAAFDAASNVSPQSASLSVTTPANSRRHR